MKKEDEEQYVDQSIVEVAEEAERYVKNHLLDQENLTVEQMLEEAFINGVIFGTERAGRIVTELAHDEGCAQREKILCPANKSLHSEAPHEHWWSGWPGAYCMKCGSEDKDEICLADNCKCHCHDDFWESVATMQSNDKPQ